MASSTDEATTQSNRVQNVNAHGQSHVHIGNNFYGTSDTELRKQFKDRAHQLYWNRVSSLFLGLFFSFSFLDHIIVLRESVEEHPKVPAVVWPSYNYFSDIASRALSLTGVQQTKAEQLAQMAFSLDHLKLK